MISREELQAAERDLERQRQLVEQQEQERLAREAAAKAAQEQQQQEQITRERSTGRGEGSRAFNPSDAPERTEPSEIREAAMSAEVQNPDEQRERGVFTQVGEFLQNAADAPANFASQLTGGLIPSADQQRENAMGIPVVGPAVVGGGLGIESGLLTPVTLGARATNQQTPWTQKPAVLEGSPVGEAAFTIMEIVTPSLIVGAAIPGGVPAGLVGVGVESAVETAVQTESSEDLIASRTLAAAAGEIAEYLEPGSGKQLAIDLVEGKTAESKVLISVAGFLQNLGINIGVNQLIKGLTPGAARTADAAEEAAAQATGKSVDDVTQSIDNTTQPRYSVDEEPFESARVSEDTDVPVSKPPEGNEYVNPDALSAESLRDFRLDADYLTSADRKYFSNIAAVADDVKVQNMIEEASKTFERLKGVKVDEALIARRVQSFWLDNKQFLDTDTDYVARSFIDADFARPITEGKRVTAELAQVSDDTFLREYATLDPGGYAAAAMIGEEMGTRAVKLARQAVNLDANGVDFTSVVENLIDLQDRLGTFMVPLRRAKREWNLGGTFQQRKTIRSLRDADVVSPSQPKVEAPRVDAPARELEVIKRNETDEGRTLKELWDAYQAGDADAGKTLKEYLNAVAYSNPQTAVSQIENLTEVLKSELFKGNKGAFRQLRYASMLGRLGTQVVANASTIARLIAEPIGGVVSPVLGGGKKADAIYALGQLAGGFSGFFDAVQAGARTFKTGITLNSGTKLDGLIQDIKLERAQLDAKWQGLQRQMNADGASKADMFTAHMWYQLQQYALHPFNSLASRGLMAGDEFGKSLFGAQVASGRAWKEAFEQGKFNLKAVRNGELDPLVKAELEKVFKDGKVKGKITDADVLEGAKNITMQGEIPKTGNFIDSGFRGLQNASQESEFWSFFFPFVKAGYNSLEIAARFEPTGQMRRLIPRYNAIMKGELGEVARQQLQSQLAFGRLWTAGSAYMAWNGMITGYSTPPGTPQTSILIPADNADGYIAVSYARLEPFATLMSVTADLVQGLRYTVIHEKDYQRFAEEMVFAIGMSTFDKSFLQGMHDITALLNMKRYGDSGGASIAKNVSNVVGGYALAPAGQAAALTRAIASYTNPYMTISKDKTNIWNELAGSFRSRFFGGHGNPIQYNVFTGEPMMRTIDLLPGKNRFTATISAMLNEAGFPGSISNASMTAAQKELGILGFEFDQKSKLSTWEGIELSPELQSKLSAGMHKYGRLNQRLEAYFNGNDYKKLRYEMKKFSASSNANKGSLADVKRQEIFKQIRQIFREAKDASAKATLAGNPEYQRMRNAASGLQISKLGPAPNTTQGKVQGLVDFVNTGIMPS